uniref:Choline transporter-like protein 4 n=1 Tax=Romanomermis culicivorax TaxID=13658 RepID=A0A915JSM7_ROMCU
STTDVFCCIAFGIFIIVFGLVAIAALYYGDPRQIVYPTDSAGRLCGVKTKSYDFRTKSHLVFLDWTVCFDELSINSTQCSTPQICVNECPKKYFAVGPESQYDPSGALRLINDTICISEKAQMIIIIALNFLVMGRCIPDVLLNGWTQESINKVKNMVVEPKKDLYDALNSNNATGFAFGISSMTTRFFERIGADLRASWWQILLGLLLTVVLGFAWIYIMRFIAAYMVWASIILSLVLLWGGKVEL